MDAKLKQFEEYAWSQDQRWHRYLDNIYPMPGPAKLEERKKKFYKLHVDRDFDVDYKPDTAAPG